MATKKYTGYKFFGNESNLTLDDLTLEEALHVSINGVPFTITMRTPGQDHCLVRGLLHAESILDDILYSPDMILRKENNDGIVTMVDLKIPEDKINAASLGNRNLISASSCGICGKTEIMELGRPVIPLNKMASLKVHLVEGLFSSMHDRQDDFRNSGGTHAAAAFNDQGTLLCTMEDIGRHNAVDKVIGSLILKGVLEKAACLTVSGRISFEIVSKCYRAGIPILAAVSAPSTLAVDYAEDMGITLLAFCRDARATCYSHPDRIKGGSTNYQVS